MISEITFIIENNYQIVYFIYGLVFFTLGITIAIKTQRESRFKMAKSLWLLSTYGILHAFTEWGRIFIGIESNIAPDKSIENLLLIRDILRALSFLFLFYFGANLIYILKGKRYHWLTLLSSVQFVLWLFIVFFLQEDANIWSRYLLATPAALLTSYAFYLQREQIQKLNYPNIDKFLLGSSISFAIYFILGGLIVPSASFFPASFLNEEFFFRVIGIPIEIMRIVFGITTIIFIIEATRLFNMESKKKSDVIKEIITVNRERQRISRDMHDGILQSIYVVGLKLEMIKKMVINSKPQKTLDEIVDAQENLESIMQDIRNYIFELHKGDITESDFKRALVSLVHNLQKTSVAQIDLQINDEFVSPFASVENLHLFHIITELVHNAIKHSQSTYIQVSVKEVFDSVILRISDNGIGFKKATGDFNSNLSKRYGITNVQDRVEILGGTLNISSLIGYGTTVNISIPSGGEKNEKN